MTWSDIVLAALEGNDVRLITYVQECADGTAPSSNWTRILSHFVCAGGGAVVNLDVICH